MFLLERIVGQKSEALACNVLWYLLQRSPELRAALVRLINRQQSKAWIELKNRFSIETEVSTNNSGRERGRADLVFETDNAVIGVEVKFDAVFQQGQPEKYAEHVAGLAQGLERLRDTKHACLVLVLLPDHRKEEAVAQISRKRFASEILLISWEELLHELSGSAPTDPPVLYLLSELEEFVLNLVGRKKNLREIMPRLRELVATADHNRHGELLSWLWPVFRDAHLEPLSTRLGTSKPHGWTGYYFLSTALDNGLWGWYGFVDLPAHGTARSELIFGASFEIEGLDSTYIEPVEIKSAGFDQSFKYWRVNFDESWDYLRVWHERLRPLQNAVRRELEQICGGA